MIEKDRRLRLQREALLKIKELTGNSEKTFVQLELPRVSKLTLEALVNKGILKKIYGVFENDGPEYYQWTGLELD